MEGFLKCPVSVVGSNKESPLDNQSVDWQAQPSRNLIDHQQCGLNGNEADSGWVTYPDKSQREQQWRPTTLTCFYSERQEGPLQNSVRTHTHLNESGDGSVYSWRVIFVQAVEATTWFNLAPLNSQGETWNHENNSWYSKLHFSRRGLHSGSSPVLLSKSCLADSRENRMPQTSGRFRPSWGMWKPAMWPFLGLYKKNAEHLVLTFHTSSKTKIFHLQQSTTGFLSDRQATHAHSLLFVYVDYIGLASFTLQTNHIIRTM